MENVDEALNIAMGLAYHWGILHIPDDKEVVITGFTFTLDAIDTVGVAMTMQREPGRSMMTITDNTFLSCTVIGLADRLVKIANDACRADTQPGSVD